MFPSSVKGKGCSVTLFSGGYARLMFVSMIFVEMFCVVCSSVIIRVVNVSIFECIVCSNCSILSVSRVIREILGSLLSPGV